MIVYLVRHGLSMGNVAGLVTGSPRDCLVDDGVRQAVSLRGWLSEAGVVPDAFYVSHWARAQQTAELLYDDVTWVVDKRIGETDAGSAADLPLQSFLGLWPDFYASPANCYPGGESHQQLSARVSLFWRSIQDMDVRSVLLVTHSGPISCILQNVLGIGMERFPAFLPAHASVSVLESVAMEAGRQHFRLKGFSLGPLSNIASGVAK